VENRRSQIQIARCAAALLAGVLLAGAVLAAPAGGTTAPSSPHRAVVKPGASCTKAKLGTKVKAGKKTLVCSKVGKKRLWEVSKPASKGPSTAKIKKSFVVAVAPAEAALQTFVGRAEALGTKATPSSVAKIAAPLIVACQKMDTELSALHATGKIGKELATYVVEDRTIVGLLKQAGSQSSRSLLSWGETLKKDGKRLLADSDVLRSALGLPRSTA